MLFKTEEVELPDGFGTVNIIITVTVEPIYQLRNQCLITLSMISSFRKTQPYVDFSRFQA